jgi:hypothetical protein
MSGVPAHNKQLQRTVMRHRSDGASTSFHYALASRVIRQRAAARLKRSATSRALRRVAFLVVALFATWNALAQDVVPREQADDQAWRAVDAQIQLVWSGFCSLLRAGDINGALEYFAAGKARARYAEAFSNAGDYARQLPESWGEIKMIEEFYPFVSYSLFGKNAEGERRMYTVIFYRDQRGQWFIESL